jgi:hypothetical protein
MKCQNIQNFDPHQDNILYSILIVKFSKFSTRVWKYGNVLLCPRTNIWKKLLARTKSYLSCFFLNIRYLHTQLLLYDSGWTFLKSISLDNQSEWRGVGSAIRHISNDEIKSVSWYLDTTTWHIKYVNEIKYITIHQNLSSCLSCFVFFKRYKFCKSMTWTGLMCATATDEIDHFKINCFESSNKTVNVNVYDCWTFY